MKMSATGAWRLGTHLALAVMPLIDAVVVVAEVVVVEVVEVDVHKSRRCLLLFLYLTPLTSLIQGNHVDIFHISYHYDLDACKFLQ